jgi:energy-coupling factor transport system ATP-binding protein
MKALDSGLLTISDLSFRYPATDGGRGADVLAGLTLTVSRGSRTTLFAAADAGKTTLARIIAGLVPRFTGGALGGNILCDGRDVRALKPYDLVQTVGLVAQDSEEQILTTRCDTEVAFALESLGMLHGRMREQVSQSLQAVGLSNFADRNPATLSGGEKKRLLVACLHAIRPSLWLLDEALGELDSEWKTRILDLVAGTGGTTFLMESRWSRLSSTEANASFLLDHGRIRAASTRPEDESFAAALMEAGIRQGTPREPRQATDIGSILVQGLKFRFQASTGFELGIDSLDLRLGETCALVGRNGSGKSTLGKILCGLLRPQAGTIGVSGQMGSRALGPEDLRAKVGYLFQNPDHQIYLPSVRDELSLGLRQQRMDKQAIEARVAEAAGIFGLTDLSAPPSLLSYGARRRLQAATFFLLSRDLLILDEIDTGLSYREVASLIDCLASRVPGLVLITHDLELARSACTRILTMDEGRITGDARQGDFDSAAGRGSEAVRP